MRLIGIRLHLVGATIDDDGFVSAQFINDAKILAEESVVTMSACVTCLDYHDIKAEIEAGEDSTMSEIVAVMHICDKVIHI